MTVIFLHFPDDEVFLGLRQGRLLWGGHSHRMAKGAWKRLVDESTSDPEADAVAVSPLEAVHGRSGRWLKP